MTEKCAIDKLSYIRPGRNSSLTPSLSVSDESLERALQPFYSEMRAYRMREAPKKLG